MELEGGTEGGACGRDRGWGLREGQRVGLVGGAEGGAQGRGKVAAKSRYSCPPTSAE